MGEEGKWRTKKSPLSEDSKGHQGNASADSGRMRSSHQALGWGWGMVFQLEAQ